MRHTFGLITLIAILAATPSFGERDLAPSMTRTFDVCPDRPEEPEWMQEIDLRSAYQRVLVQHIYRAQNLARIVAEAHCSCETRFPAWDAAEAAFHEGFAATERWEMLEASDTYSRQATQLRPKAMAICEAEGNW